MLSANLFYSLDHLNILQWYSTSYSCQNLEVIRDSSFLLFLSLVHTTILHLWITVSYVLYMIYAPQSRKSNPLKSQVRSYHCSVDHSNYFLVLLIKSNMAFKSLYDLAIHYILDLTSYFSVPDMLSHSSQMGNFSNKPSLFIPWYLCRWLFSLSGMFFPPRATSVTPSHHILSKCPR